MIAAFYVVSVLWLVTLAAWVSREKQHAIERMETLKLFRSESLSDYTIANTQPKPGKTNFIQTSIGRAYSDLLGDDDD